MEEEEFRNLVSRMWENVPSPYREHIVNVALLVEDEPSVEIQDEEGMLLGLYQGIPNTLRGEGYGVGMTLPDTITLFRLPILEEANADQRSDESLEEAIERVAAETLWHEVGHYFGLSEEEIHEREVEGTNAFRNAHPSSGL